MFERFTDRARRVVVLAQEESRRLNHNYIGTEHVLLGLILETEGIAARVLRDAGLDLDMLREQVEQTIGPGHEKPSRHHIPFTPRTKRVLELSLREALQLQHNYIGTEHILLGLIREGEGVAAQVLESNGIRLEDMRRNVLGKVRGSAEQHTRQQTFVSGSPSIMHILRELQQAVSRIERRLDALGAPRTPAEPEAADPEAAAAESAIAEAVGPTDAAAEPTTEPTTESTAGNPPPADPDDPGEARPTGTSG